MNRDKQIRVWLIGILVFAVLIFLLRSVLLPFVAGLAVAYFLDPLADRLEKWGTSRLWAVIWITLGFVLVMVLALLVLLPLINGQIADFVTNMPEYARSLVGKGRALLDNLVDVLGPDRMSDVTSSLEAAAGEATKWLGGLVNRVISGGAALINLMSVLVITPVIAFYMLRDWDVMVASIDRWLPRPYAPVIRAQMAEIDRTIAGFVRGQASVCLALGSFYAIGLTIGGLDLGLIVGMISGILSFIPYVGTITGFVVSMGLALAQFDSWIDTAIIAGIFVIGQMIEGNYLTPKLVGDRIGLHPVWVIFALLAGGGLFGFLGVLLAVPLAAVIGVLVRFFLGRYLNSPLYTGATPEAPAVTRAAPDDGAPR
ncbi:AI-2E family transporter [Rhodospirillum rubrum]|uniref:AI-2E family transporter n=1 Tax=Rhodospirillum rubrum TaxID=1085 RepID=UPI001902CD47|nr:AI-2E family transporter [Rhodospirillum rubrum]MBK1664130.1 AI-2E family transporter [Rhodospirillum rubrum]MBK1675605.1 AI-2E family transporter [Rhodospirillum rubrum]